MKAQYLEEIARFVLDEASRLGASDANVSIAADSSVGTGVRKGDVEELQGAHGQQLSFRSFVGKNSATTSTSDFRRQALTRMVRDNVAMARAAEPDPTAGLPDRQYLATSIPDLKLVDPAAASFTVQEQIAAALTAEAAAFAADARITNSEGASFSTSTAVVVYGNSLGFLGSYARSRFLLSVSVVASDSTGMQVGGWWTTGRNLSALETPESVGRRAALEATRRLGARRVKSQQVPVVFDPQMAGRLMGQFVSAAGGGYIYRKSSFLADKLSEIVASPIVTIIDDALISGGLSSRPFDDEGLPGSTRTIVQDGRLETYLLGSYAGRKLGMAPNGAGTSNLYLKAGTATPEEIIASVGNGLYLQSVSGPGFNVVTGDYSLGAAGLWIDNGQLAYPVEGITVAGNMLDMFASIEVVGNDLVFRSSYAAPTLKIASMTVAGE